MRPDDGPLPPPLPVRVRPAAGETAESYIRRLARANHLRPSLLHVYVRNPGLPTGAIPIRRLAAVSGSTVTAIAHALTGLPSSRGLQLPPPTGDSPPTWEAQAARKVRLLTGQVRRTGRDSRPFITLTGRQRSSGGESASEIRGKRASRAPRATSASMRARGAPRQ